MSRNSFNNSLCEAKSPASDRDGTILLLIIFNTVIKWCLYFLSIADAVTRRKVFRNLAVGVGVLPPELQAQTINEEPNDLYVRRLFDHAIHLKHILVTLESQIQPSSRESGLSPGIATTEAKNPTVLFMRPNQFSGLSHASFYTIKPLIEEGHSFANIHSPL